jgi:hypothetical protein
LGYKAQDMGRTARVPEESRKTALAHRKLMMIPMMSDRLSLQEPPAAMMLPSLMRRGQDRSALSKFMRFQASGDTVWGGPVSADSSVA